MRVRVNGEELQLAEDAMVVTLLEALGLAGALVAVERNGDIVPRREHATTALRDGDTLEVVHFVGGG